MLKSWKCAIAAVRAWQSMGWMSQPMADLQDALVIDEDSNMLCMSACTHTHSNIKSQNGTNPKVRKCQSCGEFVMLCQECYDRNKECPNCKFGGNNW